MNRFAKTGAIAGALVMAVTVGLFAGRASAYYQPHMQNALDALKTARSELQLAATDKGGHRVNAIADVEAAIHEVHAGMHYAD